MNLLVDFLKWLLSFRRQQSLNRRETAKTLALELDRLADFMSDILNLTSANGQVQQDKIPELEIRRKRAWNRWNSILSTQAFNNQNPDLQAEIRRCLRIAHAAPGDYIDEIYLSQQSLSNAYVSTEVRTRFVSSIDRIRDATTRIRLNA